MEPPASTLYPDLYKTIFKAPAPEEDAPPASFQEPEAPKIGPVRPAKSNWHVLSKEAVERQQSILKAHQSRIYKWTGSALVSGAAATVVFFKGRFNPIVTLATFAGLVVLTVALTIRTILIRKPLELSWSNQKEGAGKKLDAHPEQVYTDIQQEFRSLMTNGIITDQDINELVAPQIDTLSYEDFIKKRGEGILPIIAKDPTSKAILRQKAIVYFSSSKLGLLEILRTPAALHLGITLADLGPFMAPKEAELAEDYAKFSARNGSDAMEYLRTYPGLMKKMSESFLTLSYSEMMSPAKEADRKRFGITSDTLKAVMIQRWNGMTVIDIIKTQKADFDLAIRNGLVVPHEWATKVLIETQYMKVTDIIDLYPDFILKGFLTAASCFKLEPYPDILSRGHTCPTHSPTLAQRMSAQLSEFTTLQSIPHLQMLLTNGLITATHPHLAVLVTQYLRTDTRNYLVFGHSAINEHNLIPTEHAPSVTQAKKDWENENKTHESKLNEIQQDKKVKLNRAETKRDAKLQEAKKDSEVESLRKTAQAAATKLFTAQKEATTASVNLKEAEDQHNKTRATLAELKGKITAYLEELNTLTHYTDGGLDRLERKVTQAKDQVTNKKREIETQLSTLSSEVKGLEQASTAAHSQLTKAQKVFQAKRAKLDSDLAREKVLLNGLSREERIKEYDKQISALEAEIQAPTHKARLEQIQSDIVEYSKNPEGVAAAWEEARTRARAKKVVELKKEKTALEAKPSLRDQLKKEKAELISIAMPTATELVAWEQEVRVPQDAYDQAKKAYDVKHADFTSKQSNLHTSYKIAELEADARTKTESRDTYKRHNDRRKEVEGLMNNADRQQLSLGGIAPLQERNVQTSASIAAEKQRALALATEGNTLAAKALKDAEDSLAKQSSLIRADFTDAVKEINRISAEEAASERTRHENAHTKVVLDLQARISLPVQQRG